MASLKEEVSLDLDMLGIAAGGILYRAADRWRVLPPSQPGMYLVIQNDGFPAWEFNVPTPYTDSGWLSLPLASGVTDLGAPSNPAVYRRTAYGLVTVQGVVRLAASNTFSHVFTLPDGFRPSIFFRYPGVRDVSAVNCRIWPDGEAQIYSTSVNSVVLSVSFPLG